MSEIKVSNLDLTPENGIGPEEKRFSKINSKVCKLKAKVFSTDGVAKEIEYSDLSEVNPVTTIDLGEEKLFNDDKEVQTEIVSEKSEPQKEFSNDSKSEEKKFSVSSLRERLMLSRLSPRMKFRRIMLDYKKFYNMNKTKISHDDFVLLKNLFTSDVMAIMNVITPDIIKGKQINTMLGLSALSKELRLAGQKLSPQMRLGLNEEKKRGAVSPNRYKMLSSAYNEFIDALLKYVFGEDYKTIGVDEMANITEAAQSDIQPSAELNN